MCTCIVLFIVLIVNSLASSQQDHTPDKAIDDTVETCYQSEEAKTSWWEVDLGSEQFIREINIKIKVSSSGCMNTHTQTFKMIVTQPQIVYHYLREFILVVGQY